MSIDNIITLDVGGQLFKTFRTTLEFCEYFKSLFRFHETETAFFEKPIFIDRDPDSFKHVLQLLRNPDYVIPEKFRDELTFFGIEYTPPEEPEPPYVSTPFEQALDHQDASFTLFENSGTNKAVEMAAQGRYTTNKTLASASSYLLEINNEKSTFMISHGRNWSDNIIDFELLIGIDPEIENWIFEYIETATFIISGTTLSCLSGHLLEKLYLIQNSKDI